MYEVTPVTINNMMQNNPELIVTDAARYLGLNREQQDVLRQILLARGVNKWLKVRRDLIAYKKVLKHKLKEVDAQRLEARQAGQYHKAAGLLAGLKVLIEVRSTLRKLCHTSRWILWPQSTSRKTLRTMNTITCGD